VALARPKALQRTDDDHRSLVVRVVRHYDPDFAEKAHVPRRVLIEENRIDPVRFEGYPDSLSVANRVRP